MEDHIHPVISPDDKPPIDDVFVRGSTGQEPVHTKGRNCSIESWIGDVAPGDGTYPAVAVGKAPMGRGEEVVKLIVAR
jgi:hypothetical protein